MMQKVGSVNVSLVQVGKQTITTKELSSFLRFLNFRLTEPKKGRQNYSTQFCSMEFSIINLQH